MGEVIEIAEQLLMDARKSEQVATVLGALTQGELAPGDIVSLDELRTRYVRATIRAFRGNKSAAARALGISRRALYRLLDRVAA